MGKRYYTAQQLLLLSYRFCVDDPYDDDQDMVNISRIFHSVLVGSIHSHHDYHTMETSQDYSVITTDITEDHQVFKKELENNGNETDMMNETNMIDETALLDETDMVDGTHSNSTNYRLDKEAESTENKYSETKEVLQPKRRKYEDNNKMQDDNTLDDGKLLDSKTTSKLSTHKQVVHKGEGIKYPCSYCDFQATTKGNLKRHTQSVHEGIKYPCPHCDYQATTKENLKKHIRSQHKSE